MGHRLSPVSDAANSTEGSRNLGDLLVRQIHQPRRGRGTQRRKTNFLGVAPNKRPPCLHVLTKLPLYVTIGTFISYVAMTFFYFWLLLIGSSHLNFQNFSWTTSTVLLVLHNSYFPLWTVRAIDKVTILNIEIHIKWNSVGWDWDLKIKDFYLSKQLFFLYSSICGYLFGEHPNKLYSIWFKKG